MADVEIWNELIKDMQIAEFRGWLPLFSMGELKYMFKIVRTKQMIKYYGVNRAKAYRQAVYDRLVSRKIRGIECEVWRE